VDAAGEKRKATAPFLVLATGVRPVSNGYTPSKTIMVGPGQVVASGKYEGKRVAVLGGGDNAFENALFIGERGATEVKLFARNLRARREFIEKVPTSWIVVGDYEVDTEAMTVNGEKFDIIGVFYGWTANNPFSEVLPLAINDKGFIISDERCRTNLENVYAIGELAQKVHPCVVTAMAEGVIAAKDIQHRLEADFITGLTAKLKRGASMASWLFNAAGKD